ncbi:lysylphosphatidylglycerol synthase transmembrane domain-containing protein [Papillibacter cinnamivorans]|uniref:Phosphatidylglycerol lysyltransferase n=1 Tax=Papillibacter cinnamivorans DSM 12816 TaxID=1122930 RepID=A0A1W2AS68_9FIRM|nr:lysylphosphatidylglycerol synthase transmembrane domain-containing protein [Papillibacter cinnamivorans]SMC63533.1 hypothetical protein SAMN02745168_1927 [Papillibacter cinnamivorans DSM 12816]
MTTKMKLKLLIGVVITVAIVYYSVTSLKDLHPAALFQKNINWWIVALSVAVYIYANYIRGLAFTHGIDKNMDRLTAFQVMGIGHAVNMVLPLHAGEGIRIVFFPADYSVRRRTELMIISAIADVVAILMISLFSVPFSGFTDPLVLRTLRIVSLICLGLTALLVIVVLFVPRFHKYSEEYLNLAMAKMMVWVLLSWILLLISVWVGLISFGFPMVESIRISLAVFAVTNIINFIPASPGAIGLFEYGTILAMAGLGIDRTVALETSLLLHLIQYMALLPMGTVLYILALHGKYGEKLRNFFRKRRQ